MKNWFDVSTEGLKQLQLGKPKHYVARELIQNAWDENTKICKFSSEWKKDVAFITVEDDSPEGFKNLSDAFTLFAPTYKRTNPEKRGRFNLGEKQAFAICEKAIIKTTKGTVSFDKSGRKQNTDCKEFGSSVYVELKMTKTEYEEMLMTIVNYIVPNHLEFFVNDKKISSRKSYKTIRISLPTEIEENNVLKKTLRMTVVNIYKSENKKHFLFEMGIPVIEIDCQFDIDVQQKVPLSVDRDSVSHSYTAILYAEVLNATFKDIEEKDSSQVWIREAMSHNRINSEATKTILDKRFGDKVLIANPFDRNSIDDAIASGYKIITGNELSKGEWENVKKSDAIQTTSDLFASKTTSSESYTPDENMNRVAELAKKIAKKFLDINIRVAFAKWDGVAAQYGDKVLTFNVKVLGKSFFNPSLSSRTLDLIIHEISHENGQHTEKSYHETITRLAGELIMLAIENQEFFK
jgi:hypothetical protein